MEPVPHANTNLRRAPVQQRSAERLARILDACAELLDETGYEQLSTRAVAVRAGVPIGSVYRFFSNKRALADALARRNLDSYAERITDRLSGIPAADWRPAIDAVLDEYLAMKTAVPGFALIDFGAPAPDEDPADDANQRVAGRLTELLSGHLGREPDEDLLRVILVCVEAADALLQLAFRTDPSGDRAIVAETRVLLQAYLARVLD
ncbi:MULTISPECIES: TetR/AcrR family transcriptional regulator [unclassified Streptomyces]|uniref:TetR/AcrR family transcriptional regulator n=1 Tax=unclassified Streptomyces TaxID=2593676 RepID=UPI00225800B4|nr:MULTISPECIES: TetR/AcrR family transcriptional regulator [unclassified Streptomyces]MCX5139257.1 TetR family transcriptional regulator [Streptomyces sp. NBC_00338]WRZ63948.1 TetR family transcriptional regulator [Streptomyces sp. NBC_01257]WSU57911.1 TetR family transcriptional regulator [Streptomyces sp. NBC_01104]